MVNVVRHILRLQRRAVLANKVLGGVSPRRQRDVVNHPSVLQGAEVKTIVVSQHLRKVEELRNQLFYIR